MKLLKQEAVDNSLLPENEYPEYLRKENGQSTQSIQNTQPTKEFPIKVFPQFYQDLINEYNECLGFQRSYSASALLSVVSSCIGNAFKVKIKNGWSEPSILYMALYGDSSMKKTPVLKSFLKPFYKMEADYQKQFEIDLENWEQLEEKSNRPKRKHIIISDATPESIIDIHSSNPKGLLYHNDEYISMINRLNQYRNGADGQFWLSAWSNDAVKVTRKTQDTILCSQPCITTIGGIQPVVSKQLAKDDRGENGFVFRILFALPENNKMDLWSEKEVNEELIEKYCASIKMMHEICLNEIKYGSVEVLLDDKAKEIFKQWYNENAKLTFEAKEGAIKAIYLKLQAYTLRLSLILDMMRRSEENDPNTRIVAKSIKGAIKLVEYFRYTAEYIHETIKNDSFKDEKDKEIFNALPDKFKTHQLIEVAESRGLTASTAKNRFLPRLLKEGKIKKLEHGYYCKEGVDYVDFVDFESKDNQLAKSLFNKPFNELLPSQQTTIIERNS